MGNSPSDNNHEKHQKPPEANAVKTADAQAAGNAGSAEMKTVEASRTNASTGSLQDRRKLLAGQDDSIEISGPNATASRMSKLNEKDLLSPQSSGAVHSIGVAHKADKPLTEKFTDFATAATTRLLDQDQQKAFIQSELNKIIGIGEGLNTAKEHTKGAAAAAWKAFTDGTVANSLMHLLREPNAINDPIFKAVGGAIDAMKKDPNTVNHVLDHVGQEILRSNEKYNAMSDREKGRFIGEVMFGMFNPEGSTEAGEAALKIADKVATHVDAAVTNAIEHSYLAAQEMAKSSPALAQRSKQLLYDYIKGHGLTGPELEYAGIPRDYFAGMSESPKPDEGILKMKGKGSEGGDAPFINKRPSPDVVLQTHPDSCVLACGEMLTKGERTQAALIEKMGRPGSLELLAKELGPGWKGGFINIESSKEAKLNLLLKNKRAWVAEYTPENAHRIGLGHVVVIDGLDNAGNIMIRDPLHGRYEMTKADFLKKWSERAVIN